MLAVDDVERTYNSDIKRDGVCVWIERNILVSSQKNRGGQESIAFTLAVEEVVCEPLRSALIKDALVSWPFFLRVEPVDCIKIRKIQIADFNRGRVQLQRTLTNQSCRTGYCCHSGTSGESITVFTCQ